MQVGQKAFDPWSTSDKWNSRAALICMISYTSCFPESRIKSWSPRKGLQQLSQNQHDLPPTWSHHSFTHLALLDNYSIVYKLITTNTKYLKEPISRFSNSLCEGRYRYACMTVPAICKLKPSFYCFPWHKKLHLSEACNVWICFKNEK